MTAANPKYLHTAIILLVLGLQSCSLAIKPDLERLYQQNREVRQPPVIVIHGLMGSRLEDTGTPQAPNSRNYYVLVYDWRQDNLQSVRKLSQLIEQIRIDYADPELKVDLVAHSMGGLIARYYLRYGEYDTLDDNDFKLNLHGALPGHSPYHCLNNPTNSSFWVVIAS